METLFREKTFEDIIKDFEMKDESGLCRWTHGAITRVSDNRRLIDRHSEDKMRTNETVVTSHRVAKSQ